MDIEELQELSERLDNLTDTVTAEYKNHQEMEKDLNRIECVQQIVATLMAERFKNINI